MSLGAHSLLVLTSLISGSETMDEVVQSIMDYREDTLREGNVRYSLREFVAQFETFNDLQAATAELVKNYGGRESLESFADQMDFDEFVSGWEE